MNFSFTSANKKTFATYGIPTATEAIAHSISYESAIKSPFLDNRNADCVLFLKYPDHFPPQFAMSGDMLGLGFDR